MFSSKLAESTAGLPTAHFPSPTMVHLPAKALAGSTFTLTVQVRLNLATKCLSVSATKEYVGVFETSSAPSNHPTNSYPSPGVATTVACSPCRTICLSGAVLQPVTSSAAVPSTSTEVVMVTSFSNSAVSFTTSGVASVIAICICGNVERSMPSSFQQTK